MAVYIENTTVHVMTRNIHNSLHVSIPAFPVPKTINIYIYIYVCVCVSTYLPICTSLSSSHVSAHLWLIYAFMQFMHVYACIYLKQNLSLDLSKPMYHISISIGLSIHPSIRNNKGHCEIMAWGLSKIQKEFLNTSSQVTCHLRNKYLRSWNQHFN